MADGSDGSGKGDGKRTNGGGHKVYLVIVPVRLPIPGRPNTKILRAAPSFEAASIVANSIPGSYIAKHYIVKEEPTPAEYMLALAR